MGGVHRQRSELAASREDCTLVFRIAVPKNFILQLKKNVVLNQSDAILACV